jgi:hypothetical protein
MLQGLGVLVSMEITEFVLVNKVATKGGLFNPYLFRKSILMYLRFHSLSNDLGVSRKNSYLTGCSKKSNQNFRLVTA